MEKPVPFPPHPCAELFPLHDGKPLWELRDDIKENGQIEDIVLYRGMVLDGRRRQCCLIMLGMLPRYKQFEGSDDEALKFVISKNLKRRHLGEAERAMIAAAIANTPGSPPDTTATFAPCAAWRSAAAARAASSRLSDGWRI